MKYSEQAKKSLQKANEFVQEGVQQILVNSLDEAHRVSVCPGATALATLSLLALGRGYEKAQRRGTECLLRESSNHGWGKIPGGLEDEEVSHLARIVIQLSRGGVLAKLSVLEQSRRLSDLVLTLGKDVVPGLEGPKPLETSLAHVLEENVQKKLPQYGRPVVVAACLLSDTTNSSGTREAIQFLRKTQMPDGSWAEDVIATSLAILALIRFPEQKETIQKAGDWLVRKQYPSGGWPAFDQLQTWAMGWTGAIYQEFNLTSDESNLNQKVQQWLVKASNSDGSYGTTPPYTHPDLDDTAVALMALPIGNIASRLTLELLLRFQNEDGSWGTFPDFRGQPPEIEACTPVYIQSLDVTIHILEGLRRQGISPHHPASIRGLKWVLSQQKKDGEFDAVWLEGRIYGTAQALELMNKFHGVWSQWGLMRQIASSRSKATQYLLSQQNSDGGWGSSMVETALTLAALCPQKGHLPVEVFDRGIYSLIERQTECGAFKPDYKGIYAKGWNYEEPVSTALTGIRAFARYLRI